VQAFLFVSASVAVLLGVLALAAATLPWPGDRRSIRGHTDGITPITFARHIPLTPPRERKRLPAGGLNSQLVWGHRDRNVLS
jgi:hypothetical protein